MGYSDQKYYDRQQNMVADSKAFSGTFTASGANSLAAAFIGIPTLTRQTVINSLKLVVITAPKVGSPVFTFLNGTNTFATATVTSTAAVGAVVAATMTNTASVSTNTFTNTFPNGGTAVLTNTITTNWALFTSAGQPKVAVSNSGSGTATASGDTWGAYEVFVEDQEVVLNT